MTATASVLIPSRARPDLVAHAVLNLRTMAHDPNGIEILVRVDSDDPSAPSTIDGATVFSGERFGYWRLHRYYNELAARASGDWLICWNDDALMATAGWDTMLRAVEPSRYLFGGDTVLSTEPLSSHSCDCRADAPIGNTVFPIFPRRFFDACGHVAVASPVDLYCWHVAVVSGLCAPVAIRWQHTNIMDSVQSDAAAWDASRLSKSDDINSRDAAVQVHVDAERLARLA